ncbi:MAG: hypothetical protein HY520_01825 [Candidatus Aenigmarchaeota archaeon]|nr:hypothetical protein [Candidatus Aenigmarchaeota archaeon]
MGSKPPGRKKRGETKEYPDEVSLIERLSEDGDGFVARRFEEGHTHVAFAETHHEDRLHAEMVRLVPELRQRIGLRTVCLEIESRVQEDLDQYLRTGNEAFLDRIIENEKKMADNGYPVRGRITGSYFDIIRRARASGVHVIAMDNHEDEENRNESMTSMIPVEGPTMVYVGLAHLIDMSFFGKQYSGSIPARFHEKTGRTMYRVFTLFSAEGGLAELSVMERLYAKWMDSLVAQSETLQGAKGFGLDLRKHGIHYVFRRHEPPLPLFQEIDLTSSNCYDGILYRR